MLRYELPTILSFTVMLAAFFKDKPHFKYIENLLATFQPFMSSLATVHQKYDGMLNRMEIRRSRHAQFKASPSAKK